MKRPKSRQRKVAVTDELLALFRRALPAEQALWRDIVGARRVLTDEQNGEALAAVQSFDMAAGVRPWEDSPLHPDVGGPLQAALLAKLTESERKAWEAYARKYGQSDGEAAPARRRKQRRTDGTPRPEPTMRWSKGW